MKYMGSKARFIKEISPIILSSHKDSSWYVEPFAGGMNAICDIKCRKRMANDINPYLIEMWRRLVGGWIPKKITKEEYNNVRENIDKYPAHVVGWIGFNCSYSGKWFGGFAGETKTKVGTIRDYQTEAIKNVFNQVGKMDGVIFTNVNYYDLDLPSNSTIYCDPPYKGTTKYANEFDHDLFWNWVREASRNGHKVFVSEYDAPNDFECIWQKEAKSSLSANGKSGGSKISVEKLFKLK